MEMKLYDKIFEVANGKMQEHGMEFSFDKRAFDCILYRNPNEISVKEFLELDAGSFLNAVYLRCLNRLPDALAYRQISGWESQSDKQLLYKKYLMLMNVSLSAEFRVLHKKMEGVEWLRKEVLKKGTFQTRLYLSAAECKACVKRVIKKYLFQPVWNRLSLEKKMAIKAFVLREK